MVLLNTYKNPYTLKAGIASSLKNILLIIYQKIFFEVGKIPEITRCLANLTAKNKSKSDDPAG